MKTTSTLCLTVKPDLVPRFFSLFQRGFFVSVAAGSTLHEVLADAGFAAEYLEERVQTIFVDGKVVDDPRAEPVGEGSVIALSAAMPGLAGAIFRRGNVLSALRTPTAGRPDVRADRVLPGLVRIRLYNLVAEEMGPVLLRAGILVKRSEMEEMFAAKRDLIEDAIVRAELDGRELTPAALFDRDFTLAEDIFLIMIG